MSAHPSVELPSHDVLARLAQDDPAAYEALRHELIERFIDSAPERVKPRLQGIQFRVDAVRRMSRSGLGATVKVYALMWESFLHMNDFWQEVVRTKDGTLTLHAVAQPRRFVVCKSAQIMEFRPRQSGRRR